MKTSPDHPSLSPVSTDEFTLLRLIVAFLAKPPNDTFFAD